LLRALIGHGLSERLSQPFIVRTGPARPSNIGTEAAVKAPPDGYTTSADLFGKLHQRTLYESSLSISCETLRRRDPCADTNVMENKSNRWCRQTVPEFCRYAKANPGKTNMARPGAEPGSMFQATCSDDDGH